MIDQSHISSNVELKLIGDSVSFECIGLYFIEWEYPKRGPINITVTKGKITVTNINYDALGRYTCLGYIRKEDKNNRHKKISAFSFLLLKGKHNQYYIFYTACHKTHSCSKHP